MIESPEIGKAENPGLESKIKSSMVTVLNMILATSELQVFGWVGLQVLGSRNRMMESPKIENPKIQNPGTGVPSPAITSLAMKISQVFRHLFFDYHSKLLYNYHDNHDNQRGSNELYIGGRGALVMKSNRKMSQPFMWVISVGSGVSWILLHSNELKIR